MLQALSVVGVRHPLLSEPEAQLSSTATAGDVNAAVEAGEVDIAPAVDPNTQESKSNKCQRGARLLREINLSFGEFVVTICYGDPLLRNNNDCISARNSLY